MGVDTRYAGDGLIDALFSFRRLVGWNLVEGF